MSDLFNNPMVQAAKASMTQEQLDEYKRRGENMYNTIDFETGENFNQNIIDSVAYIKEGIKSGLDIKELTQDEIHILQTCYGNEWKERLLTD
jgi:hypothetical protein